MNRLECLNILTIRKELKEICQRMIFIAKKPGVTKGYHIYDDSDPEYIRLSKTRDYLADKLRKEWNKSSAY